MGCLRGSERAGAGSRAGSAPQFTTGGSCAERLVWASVRSGPTSLSAFPWTSSSLQVGTCGSAGARGRAAGGRGGRGAGAGWPSGPAEAGLGLAFRICTSWRRLCLPRRRHLLRAMPDDPRARPPERPVRCGCASEASKKRSLGAVRNGPSGVGPSPSPRPWRIGEAGRPPTMVVI